MKRLIKNNHKIDIMKKKFCYLLISLLVSFSIQAKNKNDIPNYEIECAGTGIQGTYLVKVSIFVKKADVKAEYIKKGAIHGVIFRGFSGGNGCTSQKAIVSNPVTEHEKSDFFNTFFQEK